MDIARVMQIVCNPDMYPTIDLAGMSAEMLDRALAAAVVSYLDEPAQQEYFTTLKTESPETAITRAIINYYDRMEIPDKQQQDDEKAMHYVALNMYPASKCHFVDLMMQGSPVQEATYWATLNDFFIDVIQAEMETIENEREAALEDEEIDDDDQV